MGPSFKIIAIGCLLGFLSGLFGVGGSSVATPILRLIGISRLVALGTPLPVTLPTALVGGYAYWRQGLVDLRAAAWTAIGGIPAVLAGSYLSAVVPGRALMALTAVFVLAVGLRLVWVAAPIARPAATQSPWYQLASVGAGVGFLSGLLANGGGFLLVPAYLMLFHMESRQAAATSLVAVALLALPGTWAHWRLGHVDLHLAALLAVGVIPATYVGARVGIVLPEKQSRLLFGGFLLLFGVLFLARTLYRAERYGWWD